MIIRYNITKTENIKYILGYRSTGNLGDAIQSVAMSRIIMDKIYAIYRDKIINNNKKIIINGWIDNRGYLEKSADCIFLGVHLYDNFLEKYKYNNIIGARDPYTEKKLKSYGLRSECIGCPTLFFERHNGERGGIYSVDCNGPGKKMTHFISSDMSWKDQWVKAIEYLETYKTAKAVYTSRLHVLLPCLAFGTPVFLVKDYLDERFTILDYIKLKPTKGKPLFVDIIDIKKRYFSFAKSLGIELKEGEPRFPEMV